MKGNELTKHVQLVSKILAANCEREECGNFTNIMHENKCLALKEVPNGDCYAFMTKEKRKMVEKEIKNKFAIIGG